MGFNAYAGQRVLYKTSEHGWRAGNLVDAGLEENGLYFNIHDIKDDKYDVSTSIDNIFFETRQLEDWELDPEYGTLISKEEFIEDIKENRVIAAEGTAYMSDGKYQYYAVPRLNENWLNKQPFDYVIWIS